MLWTIITYVLFIIGFVILIKGAGFLVEGASSIAKKYGISAFVIGITVVAFGTSLPELLVSIYSSAQGASELAIGNIIGSNISNILLVLGIAAFITPLAIKKGTVWKEIPLSLLATVVVFLLANDLLIEGMPISEITRIDGLVLIAFFIIFLYYTFGISKVPEEEAHRVESIPLLRSISYIAIGLIALLLGGKWIVDGAVFIASQIGISESLIGLTVVAIGTSLPELATTAIAAYKKKIDIAVGTIVGSNIFNILWVLGLSATIKPLEYNPILNIDIIILIGVSLLLFLFMFIGKRRILEKWQGFSFVALYIVYIIYLIYRG